MAAVEPEIALSSTPFASSCVAVVPLDVIELPKLICSGPSVASLREGGAIVGGSESPPVCTRCGSVSAVGQLRPVPESDPKAQEKVDIGPVCVWLVFSTVATIWK